MPLEKIGHWLQRNAKRIRILQWSIILLYAILIIVPACLPLPSTQTHILKNLTLFAQFAFWGIWWPFVILSIVLFGRMWCGILCPEGTLTEIASSHGLGRPIPRWMRFGGWPFIAFGITTIYGQMISVYQYPKPVLLILGGSTLAAIIVGFIYGKSNRVWCKYLCPVNGVFALLAKLAPFWYQPNQIRWKQVPLETLTVNCPTLLPLRHMTSASGCHMCGKCSGYKNAIHLSSRSPNQEIVEQSLKKQNTWESILIIYGLLGIALGAFQWSVSHWLPLIKEYLATKLIDNEIMWPFDTNAPWWLFTNYPHQQDIFSWLDGFLVIGYIVLFSICMGSFVFLLLYTTTRIIGKFQITRFNHLAQTLIPLAGCGVFIGLLANTITLLRNENIIFTWITTGKFILLLLSTFWSGYLAWKVIQKYSISVQSKITAMISMCIIYIAINGTWVFILLIWSVKPDIRVLL